MRLTVDSPVALGRVKKKEETEGEEGEEGEKEEGDRKKWEEGEGTKERRGRKEEKNLQSYLDLVTEEEGSGKDLHKRRRSGSVPTRMSGGGMCPGHRRCKSVIDTTRLCVESLFQDYS